MKWLKRITLWWGYLYPLIAYASLWYFRDLVTNPVLIVVAITIAILVFVLKRPDLANRGLNSALKWCKKTIIKAASRFWGVASGLWTSALSKISTCWRRLSNWYLNTMWPRINARWQKIIKWPQNTVRPWINALWQRFRKWLRKTAWSWIKIKCKKLKPHITRQTMKDRLYKWTPRILVAAVLLNSYYGALMGGSSWIPPIILTAMIWLLFVVIRPIKIWLCATERCGIMVKPKHFRLITKGGHAYAWALGSGLKLVEWEMDTSTPPKPKPKLNAHGKPIETKNINGMMMETNEPSTHPGAEFGGYWVGWFAPFFGYAFQKPKIERVSKITGVDPAEPIAKQYLRDQKPLENGYRAFVNRFVIVVNAELNDGSRVTVALYATGGFVRYPEKFAINQSADQFAIWESAASSSLSSFLRGYSFDGLFRDDKKQTSVKAYDLISKHMEQDDAIMRAQETIGVTDVNWHMEGWEDNSPDSIILKRQKLAEELAAQVAETRRAEAGIKAAHAQTEETRAKQKKAIAEYERVMLLLGVKDDSEAAKLDPDTKALVSQMLLAADAGDTAGVVTGYQDIMKRGKTPDVRMLVEEGAVQLAFRPTVSASGNGGQS